MLILQPIQNFGANITLHYECILVVPPTNYVSFICVYLDKSSILFDDMEYFTFLL